MSYKKGEFKKCIVCSYEFYAKPSDVVSRKYCSKVCSNIGRAIRGKNIVKECINCGKKFIAYNDKVKCCSRKCGYDSLRGGIKKRRGEYIKCNVCGKEKYLFQSQVKKGGKYCSLICAQKGGANPKGIKRSWVTKEKISKNHHNVSGKNNPNWKGGISTEKSKYRNKTWKRYAKWRNSVLERDGYKCKDCGATENLQAHHIIARKTLQSSEFKRANGVTLCNICHRKTDSWGGGKDDIAYNRRGKLLMYIMKVIPHRWQDYPTVGNYFYTKSGTLVIFCSDMKNDKYHQLIFAHEMVESALVLSRKIKMSQIDKFDINFEINRKEGNFDEPGDDINAPYHKEHLFATIIEKQLAVQLGVEWSDYEKKINEL